MPATLRDVWKADFHEMDNDELWNHYEDCLKAHDWTYDFSDDHQVWQVGNEERKHLLGVKALLEDVDRDNANTLYWKYSFFFNEDGTPKQL